ncbi:hypothetical protein Y032_0012g1800 [Ancylostoma ceylanicum]|uniref:Bee-milk protein n=1 Tax=Ancylostoma ceylanicum TaxID=53326 RepID=A0A016VDC9_9BILA|nr:hypothetical protein Y032_0012g1800 [Ancylostoma ceylanicum]
MLIFLFFIATLLPSVRPFGIQEKWDGRYPIVVPVLERKGHAYMLAVDRYGNGETAYKAVAVLVNPNEILFGEFIIPNNTNEQTDCASFEGNRGSVRSCRQFFLVSADFWEINRTPWRYGFEKCQMIQFRDSVAVLIKYDVTDQWSPKYIGTYSRTTDSLFYIDKDNNRIWIGHFLQKVNVGEYSSTKFEVLCVSKYNYDKMYVCSLSRSENFNSFCLELHEVRFPTTRLLACCNSTLIEA